MEAMLFVLLWLGWQVITDTQEFFRWLNGARVRGVPDSWSEWNNVQLAPLRDDGGTQVPSYRAWSSRALVLPRAAMSTLSIIACVSGAQFATSWLPDWAWVVGGSLAVWTVLALWTGSKRAYLTSGEPQAQPVIAHRGI